LKLGMAIPSCGGTQHRLAFVENAGRWPQCIRTQRSLEPALIVPKSQSAA
jgi:hypothetical protein